MIVKSDVPNSGASLFDFGFLKSRIPRLAGEGALPQRCFAVLIKAVFRYEPFASRTKIVLSGAKANSQGAKS
jgi:hypothetical protein